MAGRSLILGGARSGKSGYAERLITTIALTRAAAHDPVPDGTGWDAAGPVVTYVATGRRRDDDPEWAARIADHTARRPPTWRTVETTDLPEVLSDTDTPLLVDDLATWLTAVLDDAGCFDDAGRFDDARAAGVRARCADLVTAVTAYRHGLVLVSAEVGLGVVPATFSGRLFRDELGRLNAALAEVCDSVELLVAGLPLRLR